MGTIKVQGNVFDGTKTDEGNIEKARHYWKMDIENENIVIETLVDGEITVYEIIEDFHI